ARVETFGRAAFLPQESGERILALRIAKRASLEPEARHVRARKEHASALEVTREILPEIRELERGAHGVRLFEGRRIVDRVEREHEPADRVGRATTVGK